MIMGEEFDRYNILRAESNLEPITEDDWNYLLDNGHLPTNTTLTLMAEKHEV